MDKDRLLKSIQVALSDLIRSIAENPEDVFIKEIKDCPIGFEIKVSHRDYSLVLSKIAVVKTLAASLSGLAEEQRVLIHRVAA